MIKVKPMKRDNGNIVKNQYYIDTPEGVYFQSYDSIIAFIPSMSEGPIQIDINKWDYSPTTSRYRNIFLRETTKETQKKIDSGEYKLVNLN